MVRAAITTFGVLFSLWTGMAGAAEQGAAGLPSYNPDVAVKGQISSIGSDTLGAAMKLWVRKFLSFHHGVRISVRARGSSLAPPALTAGKAQLAPMSRAMKPAEIAAFRDAHGYDPTPIQVAIDALTVYVNHGNPLREATLPQIDAIFSDQRRCGYGRPIDKWGDLGLGGEWADKPIQLYGRNSSSGTYGFFRKEALCGGQFKAGLTERRGNSSLVQSIARLDGGIGYAGVRFTEMGSVRALLLATEEGGEFTAATTENALNGSYPLTRPLYIYVNKRPGVPVSGVTAEFMRMVLSSVGQQAVKKSGYIPLPADIVSRELAKLQ